MCSICLKMMVAWAIRWNQWCHERNKEISLEQIIGKNTQVKWLHRSNDLANKIKNYIYSLFVKWKRIQYTLNNQPQLIEMIRIKKCVFPPKKKQAMNSLLFYSICILAVVELVTQTIVYTLSVVNVSILFGNVIDALTIDV